MVLLTKGICVTMRDFLTALVAMNTSMTLCHLPL